MKRNLSITLKAAFLLVVFALNSLVGFACSVGMDMGFNQKHHDDEATEAIAHIHKDGKQRIHHEEKQSHSQNKAHNYDQVNNHYKPGSENGNCCADKVNEFQQVDKSVPKTVTIVHPVFFMAVITSHYNINIFPRTNIAKDIKPFVRSYHPPISDIRIAIQSFQI